MVVQAYQQPRSPDLSWLDDDGYDEEPLALGPEDEDYTPAPKPDRRESLEMAEELKGMHALRVGLAREMTEAYEGSHPGHFEEDEEEIADGVIEEMPISTLTQMHDFRCGFIAMHRPHARLMGRDAIDRDEAMLVEELVHFHFRCEERQFAEREGADLRLTEPAHLQRYGMLVGLDVLNPADPYCGLAMSLIDPATVYPVWGGAGGVQEVYRVYSDTAPNVAGNFGGPAGSSLHEEIAGKLRRDDDESRSGARARTDLREVVEVWNRDHVSVFVDEKEVFHHKHGYRRTPFTIVVGGFGMPAASSIGSNREPIEFENAFGRIVVNDASLDLARKIRPYDWKKLKTHRIAEAVAGRELTMFKWSLDPHKVLEQDPLSKNKQEPIGALRPGKTTRVMIPNKLNLITPVVDPLAMAGLNMALAANAQTGVLGQLASGMVPPQTSGSALNAMIDMGGAADATLVRVIELFWRLRAEFRLYLNEHFGGMLGKRGERGYISVPSSTGYQGPLQRVTPRMIKSTGRYLEVEAYNWRPDVTVAQYLSTLRAPSAVTGLPLISDETAMRKLKAVPDPDRERERIEDEQLLALPTIARQRQLRRLQRERDQAIEEGDEDSADDAQTARLVLEFMQEQEVLAGTAPPPIGEGMPAPQLGAPAGGGGPALPGTSLPDQGIAVGTDGGRPVGARPRAMTPVGGPRQG